MKLLVLKAMHVSKCTDSKIVPWRQGQRALDFVLRNQGLIDKTLLFDIELVNVQP